MALRHPFDILGLVDVAGGNGGRLSRSENRGCLGFLFFGSRAPEAKPARAAARVEVRRKFLTDAEVNFFHVLRSVVGGRGQIFAQVSLGQLLVARSEDFSARGAARNRFDRKTIDFLICDPTTLRPLVAIELDDSTHTRAKRQARDEQVDALLSEAGLPLVRIRTRRTYDTREVEGAAGPYLSSR